MAEETKNDAPIDLWYRKHCPIGNNCCCIICGAKDFCKSITNEKKVKCSPATTQS